MQLSYNMFLLLSKNIVKLCYDIAGRKKNIRTDRMNGGGKVLTVYKPEYRDLRFRQQMLSDGETMSYNHAWGGTVSFPEERWEEWYDSWIVRAGSRRYYRYLKNEAGEYIGEIAYHFDDEISGYIANVIVYAPYRGRGYGAQALELLCAAARENGIGVLYDDIAVDNPAVGLFLKHGFSETGRTQDKIILKKVLAQRPGG